MNATDAVDLRVLDAMRDQLPDFTDPAVRDRVASTRFAVAGMRASMSTAEAAIRRATKTAAAPRKRIRRSA